ncbi:MAG TPA: type B 50S ribosomal protein L31 [Candidatus Paceibacterota bacterium]|nr:type B 50S ribosomal protein L31 [Candidatus Paceibacterota bacterium]
MKKDIHPTNFRHVVFIDNSSGAQFLIGSTVKTTEKATYNGKEYDAYHVEISSASHPFFTGTEKVIDTAGRVDRFNKRRARATQKAKK